MQVRSWVAALCFLATAGYLSWTARAEPVPVRVPLAQCPLMIATYRGQNLQPFDQKTLDILGTEEYLNRVYGTPSGRPLGLYVGYYATQRTGDTIHSPQNCLPGAGWEPVSSGRLAIPVAEMSTPIEVNRYIIAKGVDRQLVLYWYQSHGRVIASEYWAKIYLTLDAIRLNRTDGALVRIVTPISGSEVEAERDAMEFVRTLFPLLGRHLPA